ncbi:hypothetical protein JX580_01385 [Thiomicrospira microaerophila]|uniref:hypothetical protein n=1 Tax=Thiomicrospira microaerophila TaxID=406020 RepID=UPI0020105106|nr:hypothetical protein [Thiomicrospira microaerophila]UQB42575.1 hypothetical protein JX580_01385 [Thiomicrospira microaerophila]
MSDELENAVEKPLSEALALQEGSQDLFARLTALRAGVEGVAQQRARQVLQDLLLRVKRGYATLDSIDYLLTHDPEQAAKLAEDFADLSPEGMAAQRERLAQLEQNAQAQLARLPASGDQTSD